MGHGDWGVRSPRWSGIRSEIVDVRGVPVHHLTADAPSGSREAPTHLLVHPMGGSASGWLDVIPPLAAHGRVVAPDMPGTITGHTPSPTRRGPRAETNARFLRAFSRTLDLDTLVVHGWSMGGLVSVHLADMAPERVAGVVLTAPTLPWRRTSTMEALGWQTIGRLGILLGPPAARAVLRLGGRQLLDVKRAAVAELATSPGSKLARAGGDPTRLSPELIAVMAEELDAVRSQPERLAGAPTAYASALSAMFVDRRPVERMLDRLTVPTLVLWGSDDPLVDGPTLEGHARRPSWSSQVVDSAGHLLPAELPTVYADVVGEWLRQAALG